jgi:outer membrane lipoprotein-sorting protein
LELTDEFPLDTFTHWAIQPLNDFLAPFIKFTRAHYQLNYTFIDSVFTPTQIELEAKIKLYVFKKAIKQTQINIKIAKENKMTLQFDNTKATVI